MKKVFNSEFILRHTELLWIFFYFTQTSVALQIAFTYCDYIYINTITFFLSYSNSFLFFPSGLFFDLSEHKKTEQNKTPPTKTVSTAIKT